MKPIIYLKKPKISGLKNNIDAYNSAIEELFFLKHPSLKKSMAEVPKKLLAFKNNYHHPGVWVYYSDKNVLVHTVKETDYFKLRTARNKNLILENEQNNFRNISVGIAGLSVGSAVLSALVISGGPKYLKIADFDTLEITNLNRIRGGLTDIGKNKTEIAAREVWHLDPYAQLALFPNGLTDNNLKIFILKKPRLEVFVDEMDSLDLKIKARLLCKENKIPVVMATDNGDSVVLDIERFDIEPKREIFHGLLGKIKPATFKNLTYKDWLKLATKIVGPQYLTPAMQQSLLQIGKSLPAVPQLGAVASVAGAAITLALRRIANKEPMPSGRYIISLEEKLEPNYFSRSSVRSRKIQTDNFKKTFNYL